MTTALSEYLNPLPLVAVLRGITPSEIAAVGRSTSFALCSTPVFSAA